MTFRKQVKRSSTLFLFLALILVFTTTVAAAPASTVNVKSSSVKLVFDGKTLVLPEGQYIFSVNNSTYVPLRFISYALQKSVGWDSKSATVSVKEPTKAETVVLKEYLLNATGQAGEASAKGGKTVQIAPVAAKFKFDGASKSLPTGQKSYMLNGTIYVPVRFVSESVGTSMVWDPATGQIKATTKAAAGQQTGTSTGNADSTGNTNTGNETSTPSGETTDPGTGAGAGAGGAVVGGGGAVETKLTYEAITSAAESKMKALQNACKTDLIIIAANYISAETDADKEKYKNQGAAKMNSCTAKFESIMSDTESKLTANGYSTAVLAEYRAKFESSIEEGRNIFKGMQN